VSFTASFAGVGKVAGELAAAPKPGPKNWPSTGNGVIRRLGNGPLQGPNRGGRAIRIPNGEHEFRDVAKGGPTGGASDEEALAGETPASETCSLHTETKMDLPESPTGGSDDPRSQKREAGVGNPISSQKSWTRSSFDFLNLFSAAESSASSASTRMAASQAIAADSSSSPDTSSDPRQLNRDPEFPISGEVKIGEDLGVGASVKRRRRAFISPPLFSLLCSSKVFL
jgi:hypothetical protein